MTRTGCIWQGCRYYKMSELRKTFIKSKDNFSTYSHNVRSINGHWDTLLDILISAQPIKFSVIALQEIWSVQKNYSLDGYGKFEYITRDKNCPPNPNCGGGVGGIHGCFGLTGEECPARVMFGSIVLQSIVTVALVQCRVNTFGDVSLQSPIGSP